MIQRLNPASKDTAATCEPVSLRQFGIAFTLYETLIYYISAAKPAIILILQISGVWVNFFCADRRQSAESIMHY